MSLYKVEAITRGYTGPTEYNVGAAIPAAVYTESFQPGTELPYRTRELTKPPLVNRGFVIDSALHLASEFVRVTPEKFDEQKMKDLRAQIMRSNPGVSPPPVEQFKSLIIPLGYLRKERGLKMLFRHGDEEYLCRLIPPPNPRQSKNPF